VKRPIGIIIVAVLAALQTLSLAVAAVVLRDFSLTASLAAILGVITSAYACVALLNLQPNAHLAVAAAGTAALAFFATMVGHAFSISNDAPATDSLLSAAIVWIVLVLFVAFYVYQTLRVMHVLLPPSRSRVPVWALALTIVISVALIVASVLA
jgi:hypothetical protein